MYMYYNCIVVFPQTLQSGQSSCIAQPDNINKTEVIQVWFASTCIYYDANIYMYMYSTCTVHVHVDVQYMYSTCRYFFVLFCCSINMNLVVLV